jgi:uncharacterized protein (TIGR02421 family)
LSDEQSVDQRVPGGRLYLDRPLPFLCVYRGDDPVVGQLVRGESSWLTATSEPAQQDALGELVARVLEPLADRFGSVLVLELWAAPAEDPFTVIASEETEAVRVLADVLDGIRFGGEPLGATIRTGAPVPPGLPPLLGEEDLRRLGGLHLGLGVPDRFRDPETGNLLPEPFRAFRRDFSRALQRTFHGFAQVQTSYQPPHYRTLGNRELSPAAIEADHALAELAGSFDFLLAVTPVNTDEAWREFERTRYQHDPRFHYRLLTLDPERLKRRLYAIPIEQVPDPTLAYLLRAKRMELDRQLTLVADRDTPAFLPGSIALYGGVDDTLSDLAERVLAGVPATHSDAANGDAVDAQGFARKAGAELARYARDHEPAKHARVEIRDDVHSLIVSGDRLLVGSMYRVHPRRVDALVQHEVGTHLLTHINGKAQPLQLLAAGLAGYEQLQEGLAVFAEYLVGGLTAGRLRLLAARVLAVRRLVEGEGFTDVFHELHTHGLPAPQAFSVTFRVFRSGGLTKDAVYLRGLADLLGFLAAGGDISALVLGKMQLDQIPLVEELRWREVLRAAPLQPAWLERPDALARLDLAREGLDVLGLLEPTNA